MKLDLTWANPPYHNPIEEAVILEAVRIAIELAGRQIQYADIDHFKLRLEAVRLEVAQRTKPGMRIAELVYACGFQYAIIDGEKQLRIGHNLERREPTATLVLKDDDAQRAHRPGSGGLGFTAQTDQPVNLWAHQPLPQHVCKPVPVAPGAGRLVCSCGWESRVSDDGGMFAANWYSPNDQTTDWLEHVKSATAK
jgi:hypothetical protein